MYKYYMFETSNKDVSITLNEYQDVPDFVTLKVHQCENIVNIQLLREDFNELCNMRYRLDFAREVEITAEFQELTLVAA